MSRARARVATLALALVTLALHGGCAATRPPHDVGFGRLPALGDLDGVYRNEGEGGGDRPALYLSSLLWPGDADTAPKHDEIAAVAVRAGGDTALTVRGLDAGGGVVRSSTFLRGTHFDFERGRLRLRHWAGLHLPAGAGDPFVGVVSETVELGLDLRGDGRYRSRLAVAGLAYVVVPVAVGVSTEVRFRRVRE